MIKENYLCKCVLNLGCSHRRGNGSTFSFIVFLTSGDDMSNISLRIRMLILFEGMVVGWRLAKC